MTLLYLLAQDTQILEEIFSNMLGKGFDLVLQSKILRKELKWSVAFLLSNATDKVTKYTGTATGGGTGTVVVGRPVAHVRAFPWAGLDPSNGDPRGYLADTITKNYSQLIGLLAVNQKYIGPANPTLFGSLQNSFSRNGITLSFVISFKAGYYFKRSTISYTSFFTSWIGHQDYLSRWQKPGDELSTTIPSMLYPASTTRDAFYVGSEAVVEKGDHIRLNDISLSYELTQKVLKKLHINNLQIYMYTNNLGILWRANEYKIDPDFQLVYPQPRTISFGLKAGL